jgi:acylglycerol lipase
MRMTDYKHPLMLLVLSCFISGCMPAIYPSGEKIYPAQILETEFITQDGVTLPLRQWHSINEKPAAVIIALHGFNDYSHFFQRPAQYLRQFNISSYAYDLRGFGHAPQRGLWAGYQTYCEDLALFTRLIADKHPGVPIYLLGESMGGAVILTALAQLKIPAVSGIILAAPAVWSRDFMPWYQTSLLAVLSHTLPWLTLTGSSVQVTASDNLDWLRSLGRDPLVIKATRVEAVHGLTDLMDQAMAAAKNVDIKTLLLYGAKDELIPLKPTAEFVKTLLQHSSAEKPCCVIKTVIICCCMIYRRKPYGMT